MLTAYTAVLPLAHSGQCWHFGELFPYFFTIFPLSPHSSCRCLFCPASCWKNPSWLCSLLLHGGFNTRTATPLWLRQQERPQPNCTLNNQVMLQYLNYFLWSNFHRIWKMRLALVIFGGPFQPLCFCDYQSWVNRTGSWLRYRSLNDALSLGMIWGLEHLYNSGFYLRSSNMFFLENTQAHAVMDGACCHFESPVFWDGIGKLLKRQCHVCSFVFMGEYCFETNVSSVYYLVPEVCCEISFQSTLRVNYMHIMGG